MADQQQVVDPVKDNSTPPPQESIEVTPPSVEDNGGKTELNQEPADPLKEKEERWQQQLQGSKAEALRLRTELEELKSMQASMKEKTDADIPISDADLAAFNALAKKLGFVTKQELERDNQVRTNQQIQSEAISRFVTEHPEYSKIGDPESDKKWEKLNKELFLYHNLNPALLYENLTRVHTHMTRGTEVAQARGESLGMAKANLAEQAKIGSRASGAASAPNKKQTPEQQQLAREIDEQLKKTAWYKK